MLPKLLASFPLHPTELAKLAGARLVVAQETQKGRRWDETKIKALTGGDKITARFMRQDFFDFTPMFKLFIAGNHKPRLSSVDEAMRRRLLLVPFTVQIPVAERDPDLPRKLQAEWPAILRWAVDGCLEWRQTGLAPPQIVRDARPTVTLPIRITSNGSTIKSGHMQCKTACPLYPRKRTFRSAVAMSALANSGHCIECAYLSHYWPRGEAAK